MTSLSLYSPHIHPSLRKSFWLYPICVPWIFLLLFISPTPTSSGCSFFILDYFGELWNNPDASVFLLPSSFLLASGDLSNLQDQQYTLLLPPLLELLSRWLLTVLRIKLWSANKVLHLPLHSHLNHYPPLTTACVSCLHRTEPLPFALTCCALSHFWNIVCVVPSDLCSISSSVG